MVKEFNSAQKHNHFYKKPDDDANFDIPAFNGYEFEEPNYPSLFNLPQLGETKPRNTHGELGFTGQVKAGNIFLKFI